MVVDGIMAIPQRVFAVYALLFLRFSSRLLVGDAFEARSWYESLIEVRLGGNNCSVIHSREG